MTEALLNMSIGCMIGIWFGWHLRAAYSDWRERRKPPPF
jgi:hypothetical protein